VALVIASRADLRAVRIAEDAGLQTEIVSRRSFVDPIAHRDAVFELCRKAGVQLVVMAGYLEHLLIPDDFRGRVINIHPALLPSYGGQGFYGDRVHEAVLAAGETQSGCTVHYVDDQFDHGPIIDRRSVPVLPGDSLKDLAARVFEQECKLLPEVIQRIADQSTTNTGQADSSR
jgi:phosphoribosylglycinamide formyltransferase-1